MAETNFKKHEIFIYEVVQIRLGLFVCKSGDISPGHILTILYNKLLVYFVKKNANKGDAIAYVLFSIVYMFFAF